MNTSRTSAVIVGSLFIIATVFFMVGQSIYGPIIGSPDYLEKAHPNRLTVIGGILVELIGVLAIPLIAVYFLPILRKHSQGLSVGYIVFRSIEAVLLVVVSICALSMIRISQGYLNIGRAGINLFQEIGVSIQAISHWTFLFAVGLIFPITALMLNAVLYKSRLVPRAISAWGFLSAALLLIGTLLDLFDFFNWISESIFEAILVIPIAVNEMVLALWLLFKGFNPAVVNADSVGANQT